MTTFITIACEWCREERTFVDEDPVEEGWLRLEGTTDDGEWWQKDFCSTECLISAL